MITIIIPTYNSEKYIKRAFDSLLDQSIGFKNLEVIFIDDASTDGSSQIIQEYSNKYDNVKSFFLNNNSGTAGKPRNIGLYHATKDYIMFLDSDDYLMDNACEILYNEIMTDNIDVVGGGLTWDGSNSFKDLWKCVLTNPNDSQDVRLKTTEKILNDDFPLFIDSIDDCESIIGDYGFVTKIYKRSFLEKHSINFPEGVIAEDSVFLLNVLLNANGIKYIDEIVYCYTQDRTSKSNRSMSFTNSKDVLKGLLDSYYKMYLLAVKHDKSRIFKQYLLPQKLDYFLNFRLLKSDLGIGEILELLTYATPLFKSCGEVNSKLSNLFEFISNEDYENALKAIFGENILNQHDVKVISNEDSFKEVNAIAYGEDLVVKLTLPYDVSRRAVVTIDGNETQYASLVYGAGTVKFSGLGVGIHLIEVSYAGDSNHKKFSINKTVRVIRADTDIKIQADSVSYGDDVIVNIALPSDVTRRATVVIDGNISKGVSLNEGIGSVKFSDLDVGEHTIEVTYKGDRNYIKSTANKTVRVNKATPEINIVADDITVGDDLTVEVQLTADVTRRVNVTVGGESKVVSLKNGKGSVKFNDLAGGSYDVVVSYDGDANYMSATKSTTVNVKS